MSVSNMTRKVLIPATSTDQWRQLLPDKHWKTGNSAKALAHCWQEADGLPTSVQAVFSRQGIAPFNALEVLMALPEHQVPLPGGTEPSHNDIWVLAKCGDDLISIAVEGKVSETFDNTLKIWNDSPGKQKRLQSICELLGLDTPPPGNIRYQLLHRTTSAVIEARRFNAAHAMMLVHSFSQTNKWFEDYNQFLSLFGSVGAPNTVTSVGKRAGVFLYFAWVQGEAHYLTA